MDSCQHVVGVGCGFDFRNRDEKTPYVEVRPLRLIPLLTISLQMGLEKVQREPQKHAMAAPIKWRPSLVYP